MRNDAILKFKSMFEEQKKGMIYSQKVVNEAFHVSQDDLLDEVDLTSVELENNLRMRLRNRESMFLKKIDEALDRISAGTFGQCSSCEEEIELKRLEARPTATHCISCKEEQEHREHGHIDGRRSKSLGMKLRLA